MSLVEPYQREMLKTDPYYRKKECEGELCVVLDGLVENRGIQLMTPPSRVLLAGEIHELIVTDEQEAKPGTEVNRIAYWGFFEVKEATVIVAGDEIVVGGICQGRIAGFDGTHMPNHLNIVIYTEKRVSGADSGLQLGDKVEIGK